MYPLEYIKFIVHFHGDRDYFECHEILEEYWKQTEDYHKNSIWVGFILFAVSCYHHRRLNYHGAERTLKKALDIFYNKREKLTDLGLQTNVFIADLQKKYTEIENRQPYESYNMPIKDPVLIQRAIEECTSLGLAWCCASDLTNLDLIHRHSRRDRSEVIAERDAALQNKR
ncbi:DUF309 domain-containing protein [Bacillus mesophilum]|uniref:DUF309 domain-containing protein n=1 Tax=Bacillus mesophilum TaxID=1071718 RepID=A0A7V7RMZ0_9BACI|nr:DUF309 domain-containing protein [Bacillus mesophilum]KAB2333739.1 DUF309 domain-containing protein [Bacillus mesophilum]